jgi:hypothetical protein
MPTPDIFTGPAVFSEPGCPLFIVTTSPIRPKVDTVGIYRYDGVKFFIHATPRDPEVLRASEFNTGLALPFTAARMQQETLELAVKTIDYHGATKINQLAAAHPTLNHE